MYYPATITRKQYIEACEAFLDVLGLDPATLLFPLLIDTDKITCFARPRDAEITLAPGNYPPDSALAVHVTIKVD